MVKAYVKTDYSDNPVLHDYEQIPPIPLTDGGTGGTDAASAKTSLGLGSAADKAISDFLQAVNNLSDLVSTASARTNLGLGTAATHAITELLQVANNLADLASASSARTNLGLGTSSTHASTDFLQVMNNLSDITNAATARLNLGLGTASTKATTDFLQTINNLSDVISVSTARLNLGLATIAASGSYTDLSNKPTIPAAQVNSDWNASTGIAQILNKPTINSRSYNNTASHSIVTGTGATGFQISSTRESEVRYNLTIVTTATLVTGAVGVIVLEMAPTNSVTPSDWVEIGRLTNGQVFSLAVAIGCTQTISGQLSAAVPVGYYVKLRSINTTGTPIYTYNSGQEVLL